MLEELAVLLRACGAGVEYRFDQGTIVVSSGEYSAEVRLHRVRGLAIKYGRVLGRLDKGILRYCKADPVRACRTMSKWLPLKQMTCGEMRAVLDYRDTLNGGRVVGVGKILEAAERHGSESDPEHESGDLRAVLVVLWLTMTKEQRDLAMSDSTVIQLLEDWG